MLLKQLKETNMNNFEQSRRSILEVCFKELLIRKTNNPKLKEMFITAADKSNGRGYNSKYGKY